MNKIERLLADIDEHSKQLDKTKVNLQNALSSLGEKALVTIDGEPHVVKYWRGKFRLKPLFGTTAKKNLRSATARRKL